MRERGYPSYWPKLRLLVLAEEPVCAACGVNPSAICDHITPLFEGGTNERTNLQGLCGACSEVKSNGERLRARGIASGGAR